MIATLFVPYLIRVLFASIVIEPLIFKVGNSCPENKAGVGGAISPFPLLSITWQLLELFLYDNWCVPFAPSLSPPPQLWTC